MKKYKVEITETLQCQEIVEAKDEQEAMKIIKEKYHNQEIVLDEGNHIFTEFEMIDKVRKRDNYIR